MRYEKQQKMYLKYFINLVALRDARPHRGNGSHIHTLYHVNTCIYIYIYIYIHSQGHAIA
jgi:hypothetical protein